MDKTLCRTPNRPGTTNIPSWKFDLLRAAILKILTQAGDEGVLFGDLSGLVRPEISTEDLEKIGSLGWHVTTVKLELETRGEIEKLDAPGPQRLVLS